MAEKEEFQNIFSQKVRAGRRTYFFDVRSTKAEDYYMTITESVKSIDDEGNTSYRKHKIFLYKEDFKNFKETLEKVSDYIITEKGEEIISNKKFDEKEESVSDMKTKSSKLQNI